MDYYGESTRLFTHLASSQGPAASDAEYDRYHHFFMVLNKTNTYIFSRELERRMSQIQALSIVGS